MSASSTRVTSRWRRTARRLRPPFVASSTGRFPWSNTSQTKDNDMNQIEKAKRFAELHVKGAPLLLYNAWDAGSAKSHSRGGRKGDRDQQLVGRGGAGLPGRRGHPDRARRANCRADRG